VWLIYPTEDDSRNIYGDGTALLTESDVSTSRRSQLSVPRLLTFRIFQDTPPSEPTEGRLACNTAQEAVASIGRSGQTAEPVGRLIELLGKMMQVAECISTVSDIQYHERKLIKCQCRYIPTQPLPGRSFLSYSKLVWLPMLR
jgi:hypothetical protein